MHSTVVKVCNQAKNRSKNVSRAFQSTLASNFYEEDQKSIQKTVNSIIDQHINPYVDEWEKEGAYPAHKVFKLFGNAGLMGINKQTEYGGLGLPFRYQVAFNEAMGNIKCGAIPMSVAVQTDMSTPALARFGSDELKREFLEPAIKGDVVTSIAVSEPSAGSDVAGIQTTAVTQGDDLIINGQKMWITNAFQADWFCLLANTGAFSNDSSGFKNKSLICVPSNLKGIKLAKKIDKLGMRSSDTAVIYFDDVRVPKKNIIGEEGKGFMYQMIQFQEERLAAVALQLCSWERAIEETVEYTRDRKAFGKSVLDNQYVHFKLAELKTEVELFRAALYQTTLNYEKGGDVTELASMLKLKAGRLGRKISDDCLQFWGGMGFTNEVLISRLYRDLRLTSIGGGSDETMLSIISKYMGTLPKN